jgi:hypothetical protein
MEFELEHRPHRYRAPTFAPPQSLLAAAGRALLGRVDVTMGEESIAPMGAIGDRAVDLAHRFEELRFELVTRKLLGGELSAIEEAILGAINAALLESMSRPSPESEQVRAAVDEAKVLLARRRGG